MCLYFFVLFSVFESNMKTHHSVQYFKKSNEKHIIYGNSVIDEINDTKLLDKWPEIFG